MTRDEMIDTVMQYYFEGKDWRRLLHIYVKMAHANEKITTVLRELGYTGIEITDLQ